MHHVQRKLSAAAKASIHGFVRLCTGVVRWLAGRCIHLVMLAAVRKLQEDLVDAIEDTGFEAHLMGLADSRSLTLRLEDWPLPAGGAEELRSALTLNFGVLHVSLDKADGTAEVKSGSPLDSSAV